MKIFFSKSICPSLISLWTNHHHLHIIIAKHTQLTSHFQFSSVLLPYPVSPFYEASASVSAVQLRDTRTPNFSLGSRLLMKLEWEWKPLKFWKGSTRDTECYQLRLIGKGAQNSNNKQVSGVRLLYLYYIQFKHINRKLNWEHTSRSFPFSSSSHSASQLVWEKVSNWFAFASGMRRRWDEIILKEIRRARRVTS